MKLTSLLAVILSLFINNLYSKEISFSGLKKLDIDDLDSLVSLDLSKNSYSLNDVNSLIQELYNSDLIEDVNLEILDDLYILKIIESKVINNIFINGNIKFKDADLINNLLSKQNTLAKKKDISKDINLIKEIYLSSGYYNVSVSSSFEQFSEDRVNLIFNIYEGDPYQISNIDFIGNNYFSDKYLTNLISSRSLGIINFLTSGSNFNPELFNFDKNKIISKYREKGFFNAEVTYDLIKLNVSKFKLVFYINEKDRLFINKIVTNIDDNSDNYKILYDNLNKRLKKNSYYYDQKIIENELDLINQILIKSNINSFSYQASIINDEDKFYLSIYRNTEKPILINKVNIIGNGITKDKVLRSKISLVPGDFFLNYNKTKSFRKLNRLRYINSVKIDEKKEPNFIDLDIKVEENKKTGNFLLAGSFSGDTGLGFALGLNDYNFLGSGNEIKSTFNINSEQSKFSIIYKQYLLSNSSLTNNYSIFNIDRDLSDSFGFKSEEAGFGYSIGYDLTDKVNMSLGIDYISKKNHSPLNSYDYIQDNIGEFDQFTLNYNFVYDSTNDLFYPSKGSLNKIVFEISPNNISDDSYYKFRLNNDLYFGNDDNESFFFISNRFGVADSFNGNLKTTNAFSLGGLNFKGFDYRGVGPKNGNIYLGGNNYYTSTLGYGSQFLFDKKDNINFRTFITSGSIWDSDYSLNKDFENRLSAGLSIDIMTAVFPISFSYAIPIQKEDGDTERRFNFTIGTSF